MQQLKAVEDRKLKEIEQLRAEKAREMFQNVQREKIKQRY